MVQDTLRDVIRLLTTAAATRNAEELRHLHAEVAPGSDAEAYLRILRRLDGEVNVPTMLRGHEFRPFLLLNGLTHASGLTHDGQAWFLSTLADALHAFGEYFVYLAGRDAANVDEAGWARLKTLQQRYFAWCIAQLGEAGIDLDGIFLTMKGDTLDQESSMQMRAILDGGGEALLASELYTEAEKALWKRVLVGETEAWPILRDHLRTTYDLPFRAAPE